MTFEQVMTEILTMRPGVCRSFNTAQSVSRELIERDAERVFAKLKETWPDGFSLRTHADGFDIFRRGGGAQDPFCWC